MGGGSSSSRAFDAVVYDPAVRGTTRNTTRLHGELFCGGAMARFILDVGIVGTRMRPLTTEREAERQKSNYQ